PGGKGGGRAMGGRRDAAQTSDARALGRAKPPRLRTARDTRARPRFAQRRRRAGRRELRLAREHFGHAEPGISQDRHRRRRCRATRLRARAAHGLSRADVSAMTAKRSGFTLIELMIALAILGLVAVFGYRALASLTDSEAQLSAEAQHWRELDGLFARLEADMREALPRDV